MNQLTEAGRRAVAETAQRHGVTEQSVQMLLDALLVGGGQQAQFNIPELGGMGQWSRGGMVMVGDMFNNALKAQVDALCTDLAGRMAAEPLIVARRVAPASMQSQSQGGSFGSMASFQSSAAWPDALGPPSSVGAQNDLRYAVFPDTRRLAIDEGGRISVYDLGDHVITGFGQQQGGGQSITLTSQHGLVRVADLARVSLADEPAAAPQPDPAPATPDAAVQPPAAPAPTAAPVPTAAAADSADDVIAMIEKLAGLRDRGILSESEFDAKKTELLSRL